MIIPLLSCIDASCVWFKSTFTVPATIIFFLAAVILTYKTGIVQFRGFSRFIWLITHGMKNKQHHTKGTINAFHALFAAMASTIGMGNVVGPSVAIMVGGPGALFWLLVYIFFGAASKFTEVSFALFTREQRESGLVGGPMQYLRLIHPFLSSWYAVVMAILFMSWSSLQSNTLANILTLDGVPLWITGISLASIVLFTLIGGAKRVGDIASTLVPIMFFLYVSFAFGILISSPHAVLQALKLVFTHAFTASGAFGGFIGASVLIAMREGIYRSIFITEAGIGTSSISHAMADTKIPSDQGLLALFSMTSDALLSLLSGLIVLVTGVWTTGVFRSTLIYEAFKSHSPTYGKYIFVISITMFVITTVIGNTFNGKQSFASVASKWGTYSYIACSILVILAGAFSPISSLWNIMDVLLTLVAVPNVIGLVILAWRYPHVLRITKNA